LVSQLDCEFRVANYNVSGDKISKGSGKCNASALKCSGLKTEKYRIQNCTYPAMLPAGGKDEVELVKCLVNIPLTKHLTSSTSTLSPAGSTVGALYHKL